MAEHNKSESNKASSSKCENGKDSKESMPPAILFVDDEEYILKALRRVFFDDSYRIFTASSGDMGLEILEHEDISVVVSDLSMPKMNGIEFLGAVQKQWPDIPKILLTGMADVESTVDAINDGKVYGFINKPWDNEDMKIRISQAVDKYELEKKNKYLQRLTSFQNRKLKDMNSHLKAEIKTKNRHLVNIHKKLNTIEKEEKEHIAALTVAERANREKRRFLATMSHEIRSPLNSVIAMNTLLLETELTLEQEELARSAKEGGQILLSLINDILDFSRIEAGFLELEESWFDLVDTVYSVADILASLAYKRGIVLVCVFHPDAPLRVFGDAVRFKQILINMVNNAIKFTDEGGVCVKVEPNENKGFVVKVEDTGIGIDDKNIERIFNEFEQETSGDDRQFEGTGLGLSIVKEIMRAMDAHVYVKSEKFVGSEFTLEFPFNCTGRVLDNIKLDNNTNVYLSLTNKMLNRALEEQFTLLGVPVVQLDQFFCPINRNEDHILLFDQETAESELSSKKKIFDQCETINRLNFIEVGFGRTSSMHNENNHRKMDGQLHWPHSLAHLSDIISAECTTVRENDQPENEWHRLESCSQKRILVAEDSIANQGVISAILDGTPVVPVMAANGEEAVQQAQHETFDLILMDLRMPKMDGLDATKLIRNESRNKATPIVAMTANAFIEDKERCLEAGMDDYLTKPVDVEKFRQRLEKWLLDSGQSKNGSENKAFPAVAENVQDLLNKNTIDILLNGSPRESIERIYGIFFEENQNRIQAMMAFHAQGDLQSLADEAHTLKSSAGSFGADSLFKKARKLETLIKSGESKAVDILVKELPTCSKDSVAALKEYLGLGTTG